MGIKGNQLQERMLRTPDLKLVHAEKLKIYLQVKNTTGESEAEVNYIKKFGAMQNKKKPEEWEMNTIVLCVKQDTDRWSALLLNKNV